MYIVRSLKGVLQVEFQTAGGAPIAKAELLVRSSGCIVPLRSGQSLPWQGVSSLFLVLDNIHFEVRKGKEDKKAGQWLRGKLCF
jgi:hypothetical protein